MNFGNPYYYTLPTTMTTPKIGLLSRLFGNTGASIGNFIDGTQKVLNIANQTIPLIRQIKPVVGNAKTIFKVMNELKKTNTKYEEKKEIFKENISNTYNDGPNFFI